MVFNVSRIADDLASPHTHSVKAPCTLPNVALACRTPRMGLQHFSLLDVRCHVQICQRAGKRIAQRVLHQPWHTPARPCPPPALSGSLGKPQKSSGILISLRSYQMSQVYRAEQDHKQNYDEETETHQTRNTTLMKAHTFLKSIKMLKLNLWQRGDAVRFLICYASCFRIVPQNYYLISSFSQSVHK